VLAPTRVELSWTASSDAIGVAGYRVLRADVQTEIATVTTTTYADATVRADTQYIYTVLAFDAAGNTSPQSAGVTVTTPLEAAPRISGLDARPANTTCTAWPRPTKNAPIRLEPYTNLSFDRPVAMLQAPNDDSRWYVVQQAGKVMRFSANNPIAASTFIDLESNVVSGGELGLLGMAFHPDFPQDPRVFVYYTTGAQLVARLSSFQSPDGGLTLDDTENVVLEIDKPQDTHNGGHIAFGPDGLLYIGVGDGGGVGDDHGEIGNGQRLTTMLGKMLRIDVDSAAPYAIPPSNPFAQNAPCPREGRSVGECPEVYAWGFRNPWRWSFDRGTGDLWLGDVGQARYEEVNRVTLGGNYGWRCREGAHDYDPSICAGSTPIDPITEYGRELGNAITGGYVYRGGQTTPLRGRYLFADFGSGQIFAWIPENATIREPTTVLDTDLGIVAFSEANDGELFVINYGGTLHRIVFTPSEATNPAPATLSSTGCVNPADPALPAEGLIPYTVQAPFWSDGAQKERWIAVPDDQKITVEDTGDWTFPNGTVLMKHFRLESRLIETRLFMRHPDGSWGGFTYEWNADQTEATLLEGGAERDVGAVQPWVFPSESQCLSCHTEAAGRTLGLETVQLNRDHLYVATDRVANQLDTLTHIDLLSTSTEDPSWQSVLVDPSDEDASLDGRARAYLHTNCSFCHRPGGPTPSTMDLRHTTSLSATNACDAAPQSGTLGLGADARLIAPGNASASIIVTRMNRRDDHAMPPLASNQVDVAGVELITEWIDGLEACD
jgi:uncharacterized repeat protein (TIGR03806 family)